MVVIKVKYDFTRILMKGLIIIAKFQRVLNNNDSIPRNKKKKVGREKLLKVDAK